MAVVGQHALERGGYGRRTVCPHDVLTDRGHLCVWGLLQGRVHAVDTLLALGANYFARNTKGDTALHAAAAVGEVRVVRQLCNYDCERGILKVRKHACSLREGTASIIEPRRTCSYPWLTP